MCLAAREVSAEVSGTLCFTFASANTSLCRRHNFTSAKPMLHLKTAVRRTAPPTLPFFTMRCGIGGRFLNRPYGMNGFHSPLPIVAAHPAVDLRCHCEPKARQSPGRQFVIPRSPRRFLRFARNDRFGGLCVNSQGFPSRGSCHGTA